MNRWINADERITIQLYDDEHEEWREEDMTIAELLDQYTDEGCPSTKQEWIPCNERLPERDGCYLATLHIKWPDREYKTVEVEEFRNGGFNERSYARVAAWMPLPEPWKGADDE